MYGGGERLDADGIGKREEYVRHLWELFYEEGVEALLAEAPEDVVWEPHGAGEPLVGADSMREFFDGLEGPESSREALVWEMREVRGHVLAIGSLRWPLGEGFSETFMAWVFYFDDGGKLCRAVAYDSPEEAGAALLAAADADPESPGE